MLANPLKRDPTVLHYSLGIGEDLFRQAAPMPGGYNMKNKYENSKFKPVQKTAGYSPLVNIANQTNNQPHDSNFQPSYNPRHDENPSQYLSF